MKELDSFLSRITIFGVLSISWVVGCVLFLFMAGLYPAGVLMCISLTFLACCVAAGYLSWVRQREKAIVDDLYTFLNLMFGEYGERFMNELTEQERFNVARKAVNTVRLFAVCGAILSVAFLLLAYLNIESMRSHIISSAEIPIPTITLPTTVSVSIQATATPLPTATMVVSRSYQETKQNGTADMPHVVPTFTFTITDTIPVAASIPPYKRLEEEYKRIIELAVCRSDIIG